jgi:hypothetical protein
MQPVYRSNMQTKSRLFAMLCAAAVSLTVVAGTADARPRPAGKSRGKKFQANKTFGLGLQLGAPTALVGKYYYAEDRAFAFGLGALGYYRGRDGVHIHFDHLWHPVNLIQDKAFHMPLYIGVGGRFFNFDHKDDRDFDGTAIGVRVPIGIIFDFNNHPLDIFVEIAPVLDFINYNRDDDVEFNFNGGVGIRYYFN